MAGVLRCATRRLLLGGRRIQRAPAVAADKGWRLSPSFTHGGLSPSSRGFSSHQATHDFCLSTYSHVQRLNPSIEVTSQRSPSREVTVKGPQTSEWTTAKGSRLLSLLLG